MASPLLEDSHKYGVTGVNSE